jgi:hypothetical protein
MSNVPEGAQLSEDGQWWWDDANQAWKSVSGESGGGATPAPATGEAPAAGGGEAGGGDVTAEDLQPMNDLNVEPGDESQLTDKTKPYFQRDGQPEVSGGEADAAIDESDPKYAGSSSGAANESGSSSSPSANENQGNEGENQNG